MPRKYPQHRLGTLNASAVMSVYEDARVAVVTFVSRMVEAGWRIEAWQDSAGVHVQADRGRDHWTFIAPSLGEAYGKFRSKYANTYGKDAKK